MSFKPSLEWIAGFFDGEGCVCTVRPSSSGPRHKSRLLIVSITQADRTPLDDLREMFGGYVGCQKPKAGQNQAVFSWKVSAQKAENFLRAVQPYCRVKHQQIEAALKLRQLVHAKDNPNRFDEIVQLSFEISQLNGAHHTKPSIASLEVR